MRSGTLPDPVSISATPQVEWGANTDTRPSPRDLQNLITCGVRSAMVACRPVRTSKVWVSKGGSGVFAQEYLTHRSLGEDGMHGLGDDRGD